MPLDGCAGERGAEVAAATGTGGRPESCYGTENWTCPDRFLLYGGAGSGLANRGIHAGRVDPGAPIGVLGVPALYHVKV